MKRKVMTSVASSRSEWLKIRRCFVRSYFNYPLYKYLIPNENKREEFLTHYMEANYNVAVRQGNSLLISISIDDNDGNNSEKLTIGKAKTSMSRTIIGGALFVPPTFEGGDWDCADDVTFFESYEEFGMREIDDGAFQNIIRHEKWETANIMKKFCKFKLQAWLAFFWAIDPDFTGQGYGTSSYIGCMKILQNYHKMHLYSKVDSSSSTTEEEKTEQPLKRIENLSIPNKASTEFIGLPDGHHSTEKSKTKTKTFQWPPTHKIPVVFFPSHCERAVSFHTKNGFYLADKTQICFRKFETETELNVEPPWARSMVTGLF